MSTDHNTLAGLENQAFALMARMHVILRRQTGRVTDIEYMRIDPVYCRHVLNLAQALSGDDVPQLCEKLQEIYFGPDGLFVRESARPSLLSRLGGASGPAQPGHASQEDKAVPLPEHPASDAGERHHIELNEAVEKAYIGRLR